MKKLIIKGLVKNYFQNVTNLLSLVFFSIFCFILNIGLLSAPLQIQFTIVAGLLTIRTAKALFSDD